MSLKYFLATVFMAAAAQAAPQDATVTTPSASTSTSTVCVQGDCPDNDAPFDLYYHQSDAGVETWAMRISDCDQCQSLSMASDGCVSFTSCNLEQTICVDTSNLRAHRQYTASGTKQCHFLEGANLQACSGTKQATTWWAISDVDCTW